MKGSKNQPTLLLVGLGVIIGAAALYIFFSEKGHLEAQEEIRIEERRKARLLAEEAKRQAWDSFQNQLAIQAQYWRTRRQQSVDSVVSEKQEVEDSLEQVTQREEQQQQFFKQRDRILRDSIRRLNWRVYNYEKRSKEQAKARQKSRGKPARPLASRVAFQQYVTGIKVNKQSQYLWQQRFGFSALGLPIIGVLYLCGFRLMAPRNRRTRIRGLRQRN